LHWPGYGELFLYFASYLPNGPVAWLIYAYGNFAGRTKMLLLDKPRPAPIPPPLCTILIPAKDEEVRIRACLQSALDQDYSNFEVIAIDDRSNDKTGQIMDEMAAADPRLRVLHIQPGSLGPGWTGKNNALFQGTKIANGKWLLFVDSDVLLYPTALTRSVTVSAYKKYDLFSVLPKLETHTLWESMLIPLCSAAAATMYLIAFNNSDKRKIGAFANGQFMLTTRAAYDSIGGHETVKDRFCEDTEIARLMKEKGLRPRVSMGDDVCAVRMYNSLPNIIKGWSRIYYAAKVGQTKHIIGAIQFLFINCFTVYPALIYGIYRALHPHGNFLDDVWLITAIAHWAIMTFMLGVIYRWSKNSPWNALLFPIGGPLLLWTLIKALMMCVTKKVEWRGTTYSHTMAQNLAPK
jgi:glycosyltransferase involved in cell wall biosynthesis